MNGYTISPGLKCRGGLALPDPTPLPSRTHTVPLVSPRSTRSSFQPTAQVVPFCNEAATIALTRLAALSSNWWRETSILRPSRRSTLEKPAALL